MRVQVELLGRVLVVELGRPGPPPDPDPVPTVTTAVGFAAELTLDRDPLEGR